MLRLCYMSGDGPYSDVNGLVYRPIEDCIERAPTLNMTQVIIFGAEQNMHLPRPSRIKIFFLRRFFYTDFETVLIFFFGNHF